MRKEHRIRSVKHTKWTFFALSNTSFSSQKLVWRRVTETKEKTVFILMLFLLLSLQIVLKDSAPSSVVATLLSKHRSSRRIEASFLSQCRSRLSSAVSKWDMAAAPKASRFLVVYHVGTLQPADSRKMNVDNIKLFLTSLQLSERRDSTFVLINISHGRKNSLFGVVLQHAIALPYYHILPWTVTESDMLTHALTLAELHDFFNGFGTIIALNQGTRGPLVRAETWMDEFSAALSNEVKLVGPVLSCEKRPHVQTHMFAFDTSILELFLRTELDIPSGKSWSKVIEKSEIGLSDAVLNSGWNIASMLHRNRWGEKSFPGQCRPEIGFRNPSGWCESYFNDSIFLKWGGQFHRNRLYCRNIQTIVEERTAYIIERTRPLSLCNECPSQTLELPLVGQNGEPPF
jgi:hypothetical protein